MTRPPDFQKRKSWIEKLCLIFKNEIYSINALYPRIWVRSPEKEFLFPRDSEWQGGRAARAFQTILQDVGYIPEKNHKGEEQWPVFHSLRSSYVMNLLTAGVPHLVVQSQTGHSDYKSLKHYIAKLKSSETKGISRHLKPYSKSRKSG